MKFYQKLFQLMLVCTLGFFTSCSDDEEVFYYSYKDIEYSIEEGDGKYIYETQWEKYFTIVNNSGAEMKDMKISAGGLYNDYQEYYVFNSESETFNPTVGYVHVPIPSALSDEGTILFQEKEGEYITEKMITTDAGMRDFVVPPMKKLVLERKLEIETLRLTYKATFQRHPKGQDIVVTGKFIYAKPISAQVKETLEDIE